MSTPDNSASVAPSVRNDLANLLRVHGRADDLNALATDEKRLKRNERDAIEAVQSACMKAAAALEAPESTTPPDYVFVPLWATHEMLYAMAEQDGFRQGDRDHPGLQRWRDYWDSAMQRRPSVEAAPVQPAEAVAR